PLSPYTTLFRSVLIPHGFVCQYVHRQLELAAHRAHHHQLLIVFLAENGHPRLHTGKELHHYRADAIEEARPEFAFENISQRRRRLDAIALRFRVHLALIRREQYIDVAVALQLLDVRRERTRIPVEILVGAELQAVHENTRHHGVAVLTGKLHERQVARMQVAHGGHERDVQLATQLIAQFFNGVNDFQEA